MRVVSQFSVREAAALEAIATGMGITVSELVDLVTSGADISASAPSITACIKEACD